ncbi:MAG: N-acetyltransferase [FCB group bacterium]|nr:N-acetyltransferase [FCB group bacterium]
MSEKSYFIHPQAMVETNAIGTDTRIWAFCNVQEGVVIGADCNIGDHCFVEKNVIIGDRVTVKNGVSLWEGLTIEDDVFIGPNAVFTNDIYPRSKVYRPQPVKTLLKKGATIGANAVVIAGHTIGQYALIGAGAVVTKDIPDYTLWYGNPAVFAGYICKCSKKLNFDKNTSKAVCSCGLSYMLQDGKVVLLEIG